MSEASESPLFDMDYSGEKFRVKLERSPFGYAPDRISVYDSNGVLEGYSRGDILPGNIFQERKTRRTGLGMPVQGLMTEVIARVVFGGFVSEWLSSDYLKGPGKRMYRRLRNDSRLRVGRTPLKTWLREGIKYRITKRASALSK